MMAEIHDRFRLLQTRRTMRALRIGFVRLECTGEANGGPMNQ